MKIEILGMGCSNCVKLYDAVRKVVSESKIDAKISKVDKITDIMNYGVMFTPALVIDGKVIISGRVPSYNEIKKLILAEISAPEVK